MPTSIRRPALVAALALVTPVALAAQDAAPACDINMFQPTQLATASIAIQRAAGDPASEAGATALREAARQLQDERRFATNPVGLAYAKAQIFVLWLHRPGVPATMTARDLNLGRDRETPINLLQTADSLLSIVEASNPACAAETLPWRQSKPWNERLTAAYRLINEGQTDSASMLLGEVRTLDRTSPFLFNAYAQLALRAGRPEGAVAYLDTAIAKAEGDTSLVETRRQMRTQQGSILQEWGMSQTDEAQKKTALTRAARTFLGLAHEEPGHGNTAMFVSAGLEIGSMLQDSLLQAEGLAPMLASPEGYTDLALLVGAEFARLGNRIDDAIKLYQATVAKNPNSRDANYFLAYYLLDKRRADEAMPLLDKLLEIDPSNPDNYILKSIAIRSRTTPLQERLRAERNAQARAALNRDIAAINREADALGAQEQSMPHKLQVIGFDRRAEGAKVTGNIENRGRAAKAFTVELSFLDLSGTVVETLTVTTAEIAPGAVGAFEVESQKPGIVAWRYKALQ